MSSASNSVELTQKKIFKFWLPLAATWLMMSLEGPFIAAIIARLADPKYNLAAYGVAFSFALIVEAPVIMIMSASTALVKDYASFKKLRNFTYLINGSITLLMVIFLIPSIFYFVAIDLISLPAEVARLTHIACIVLLPWPGTIGYRRFYQGILIRNNLTRRVAYGTVIRLTMMSATGAILYSFFDFDGAIVGAAALTVAVTSEAIASKFMSLDVLRKIKSTANEITDELKYKEIFHFYYPLALTSLLGLGVHPMVTFFIGQSRMPLESLAVLPVINSLVFIFRSMGLSFQEVGIALLGKKGEGYKELRKFALRLGLIVAFLLLTISLTPLSTIWFRHISGLSLEMTAFAILPTIIIGFMPGLTVLISFQRSILVTSRNTKPITYATAIEVTGIIITLYIMISEFSAIGVIAAMTAYILGRLIAVTYLFTPFMKTVRKFG